MNRVSSGVSLLLLVPVGGWCCSEVLEGRQTGFETGLTGAKSRLTSWESGSGSNDVHCCDRGRV